MFVFFIYFHFLFSYNNSPHSHFWEAISSSKFLYLEIYMCWSTLQSNKVTIFSVKHGWWTYWSRICVTPISLDLDSSAKKIWGIKTARILKIYTTSGNNHNTYLLWLKITNDWINWGQDFFNERHGLSNLHLHKLTSTLLSNLDKSVTCHVLDTIMCFWMEET